METFITAGNLKIYAQMHTAGEKAVVFLHNSSGSSAIWDAQFADDRFKNYTLVRFDLPGHGRSARSGRPEKDYTLTGMAASVYKVLETLALKRYIIVALSLATNLVAETAVQLHGCEAIFMAGASVVGGGITPADILLPFEYGEALFAKAPDAALLHHYIKGLYYVENKAHLEKLVEDYRKTDPAYRAIMGASVAEGKWTNEIAHLIQSQKKMAWVYGEKERIINPAYLDKLALPKWREQVASIANAGHLINLDQPDAFNEMLSTFVEEVYSTCHKTKKSLAFGI